MTSTRLQVKGQSTRVSADGLPIGEVARRAGLSPSAIRYHEREGLLAPPARKGGKRRYDEDVMQRLTVIGIAQDAGFSLKEIRTLLHGFTEHTPANERWRELAQQKLPDVDTAIRRLQAMRDVLEDSLRCNCLTLDACASDYAWQHRATGKETRGGRLVNDDYP